MRRRRGAVGWGTWRRCSGIGQAAWQRLSSFFYYYYFACISLNIPACKFPTRLRSCLVGNDIFMRKLKCERRVWGFVFYIPMCVYGCVCVCTSPMDTLWESKTKLSLLLIIFHLDACLHCRPNAITPQTKPSHASPCLTLPCLASPRLAKKLQTASSVLLKLSFLALGTC